MAHCVDLRKYSKTPRNWQCDFAVTNSSLCRTPQRLYILVTTMWWAIWAMDPSLSSEVSSTALALMSLPNLRWPIARPSRLRCFKGIHKEVRVQSLVLASAAPSLVTNSTFLADRTTTITNWTICGNLTSLATLGGKFKFQRAVYAHLRGLVIQPLHMAAECSSSVASWS